MLKTSPYDRVEVHKKLMFNWRFVHFWCLNQIPLPLCVTHLPAPSARSRSPPVFFLAIALSICDCPGLLSPSLWFLQSCCFSCLLSLSVKCVTPPVCSALAVPCLWACLLWLSGQCTVFVACLAPREAWISNTIRSTQCTHMQKIESATVVVLRRRVDRACC